MVIYAFIQVALTQRGFDKKVEDLILDMTKKLTQWK